MSKAASLGFAVIAYAVFFATFLYLIGFVGDFAALPRTVDRGIEGPIGVAIAVDLPTPMPPPAVLRPRRADARRRRRLQQSAAYGLARGGAAAVCRRQTSGAQSPRRQDNRHLCLSAGALTVQLGTERGGARHISPWTVDA